MKKLIFFFGLLIFLTVPSLPAKAEIFSVHFYYDANTKILSFNKSKNETVTYDKDVFLSISEFNASQTDGAYALHLYDVLSNEALLTEFNAVNGPFDINIPYFSIASSMKVFEKSSGKEMLSANLSKFITCNGNGTCEYEKGETALNCIGDCANSNTQFSEETFNKLKAENGIIKDPITGEIQLTNPALINKTSTETSADQETATPTKSSPILLILSILALLSIIGFFVYKKIKESRN